MTEKQSDRTVRDAILDAHRAVGFAEAERAAVFTGARCAGLSLRTIAEVIGVTASTVMRWTDNGEDPVSRQSELLDLPASTVATGN